MLHGSLFPNGPHGIIRGLLGTHDRTYKAGCEEEERSYVTRSAKPDIIAHFVFREIPILNIQYAVTT